MTWIASRPPDSTLPIILRTRYFDDLVQRAAADGLRQFVLLAAGLDTRAYRLSWPAETVIYELDQPPVLAYKEIVLAEAQASHACDRRAIPADLTGPWFDKLCKAGFDADTAACFLLEGFLYYLPSEDGAAILDQVTACAAVGSVTGFDVVNSDMLTSEYTRPWLEMQVAAGAPWIGVLNDPVAFLAARGWRAELSQAGQADAHHGRWKLPVLPVNLPGAPHNWFVTACKESPIDPEATRGVSLPA
jgi:methyltransferase (TIGR00027 family)